MTNVPQPTFGDSGFLAPKESDIVNGLWQDFSDAFGGALNQSPATPQGQLVASEAEIIGDCNNQFLALANGVDPAYASGRMQDAIGRIYFIERIAATSTTVTATCTGAVGTIIPPLAIAIDSSRNQYSCLDGGTIPSSGTIDLVFQCVTTGPIPCPIGALGTIYQAIPGWDTINNAVAGVVGRNVETRREFEDRRSQSVAHNAQGSVQAVLGAVLSVDGVEDAYVVDNPLGTIATIGGATLAPHSLYASVYGGSGQNVAMAIWTKKSPGCDYNGNTTVTVEDQSSPYQPPYPSYLVTFERPAAVAIKFAVKLALSSAVPADAVSQVQAAILSAFSGGDGGARARIGSTIYSSRFYAPVAAIGSWVQIVSIQIGTDTANLNSVAINIDKVPTLVQSDISVTIS